MLQVKVLQLCREIAQMYDRAGGESAGSIERILQLANVSGPLVLDEGAQGVVAQGMSDAGFAG